MPAFIFLPAVFLHVAAGGVAILAGFAALGAPKGRDLHRKAGTVFFIAMLLMAGIATVLATLDGQKLNAVAGAFTTYLTATGWLAVRRPPNTLGGFERLSGPAVLLLAVIAAAIGGLVAALPGLPDGDPTSGETSDIYFAFAALALVAGLSDLRVVRRGGVAGASRLARHLWRLCLALFIAAGSFFFGQADQIPATLRGPHLAIPPLAALLALAFWMVKVRLPRRRLA